MFSDFSTLAVLLFFMIATCLSLPSVMSSNTIKFSQIAFAFEDASNPESVPTKPVENIQEETELNSEPAEEQPVNVCVRLKALKEALPKNKVETAKPAKQPESKKLTEVAPIVTEVPVQIEKVKSNRGRKSLKTMDADTEDVNVPEDEILFQKQYYSIGDVAEMFKVNTSLIRFWANEFEMVQPRKNRKGDRHFRPIDIKHLQLIHDLLRRRKLTIEGAKDFLKKNKKAQERFEMIESLRKIRFFLQEVKSSLS
jgi:DNA-binding transcriptional MerR regulator